MNELLKQLSKGEPVHMVVYPDGGCRGNPPMAGGGLHGYFYVEDESDVKVTKETPPKKDATTSHGYSDANNLSALCNYGAKVVKPLVMVDSHIPLPLGTNNIGELEGMIAALTIAVDNNVKSVVIAADSKYALEGMLTHMHKWAKVGWVKAGGMEVKNLQQWQKIYNLVATLDEKEVPILAYWVMGHSDNLGNDSADEQATRGLIMASKGLQERITHYQNAKGYWNYKADYNRLFCLPAWYFSTRSIAPLQGPDGRYIYYTGRHGKEIEEHGKIQSEAAYGILFLKEKEPALEALRAYQEELCTGNYGSPFIANLLSIFTGKIYTDLCENGTRYVHRPGPKAHLEIVGDHVLTQQQDPPLMAWNAEMRMNVLRDLYYEYLGNAGDSRLVVTDISTELFEVDLTKKKLTYRLKPFIEPTTRSIKVKVGYNVTGEQLVTELALNVGQDMPTRNALSAIASDVMPSVKVVTWRESDRGFRYAVVVEVNGDSGIWAGMFSNLHILV